MCLWRHQFNTGIIQWGTSSPIPSRVTVIWGKMDQFSTLTLNNSIENRFFFSCKNCYKQFYVYILHTGFLNIVWKFEGAQKFKKLAYSKLPHPGVTWARSKFRKTFNWLWGYLSQGEIIFVVQWRFKEVFPSISIHKIGVGHLIS